MWNTLREIRKFTPRAEVDRILGVSPVQIEDRPAWYYGGGGETQRLVDGSMAFLRRWIAWEEYEFYFYGKSRRTKVTGFRFVQPE